MTVKKYIKETLKDIREAKEEENFFLGIRGVIEFDIATIAVKSGKAGMKIGVWALGGEFGGNLSNQITSRIKFSIQTRGAIAPGEGYRSGSGKVVDIG